ncbi:MAG: hypothetical protein JXR58_08810 [Bacteroidales bacterium]|nr:hypothetical protein [Bacteroidales bacterium]
MKLFLYIESLRFRQLFRILVEIGLIRALFVLGFTGYLLFAIIEFFNFAFYADLISFGFASSVISIHLQRKDKAFVRKVSSMAFFVFLTEYLLLGLPVYFCSILYDSAFHALLLLIVSLAISLVNTTISFRQITFFKTLPFIPSSNIEWKSGFRRKAVYIALCLAGGLWLSHINPAPAVAIIIITFIVCSFYTENEPEIMLQNYGYDTYMVLLKKIFQAVFMLIILISPLIIKFLYLYPNEADIFAFAIAVCIFTLAFSIIFKYAVYEPATIVERNVLINGFVLICFLIPYVAPLPIIMLIYYTGKASRNLKKYLHAYN